MEDDTTNDQSQVPRAPNESLTIAPPGENLDQTTVFELYKAWENNNIRIRLGSSFNGPLVYHAVISSEFRRGAFNVQLRTSTAGNEVKTIAYCVLKQFSRSVTLGLGGPGKITDPVQLRAKRSTWLSQFNEYALVSPEISSHLPPGLVWHCDPKGDVCRDTATEEEAARFTRNELSAGSKIGELRLTKICNAESEQLLLISWLAVHEKQRRSRRIVRVWKMLAGAQASASRTAGSAAAAQGQIR